jgi:hypothetical protein
MTVARQDPASPADAPPTRRQLLTVLLASGAIGMLFGVQHAGWQDALEPAQVLAGIVRYPADSPVYLYSTRTWTVIHQLLALGLQWGFTERTLSALVSGIQGMLSLQALAVVILAVSGDGALAIVSAFFIFFTGATAGGVNYPVILLGTPYTYGVIGLSYALLTVGLFGAGRVRTAAALLGFGPAVHLPIGLLTLMSAVLAVAVDRRAARRLARRISPHLLAGTGAALVCAAIHYGGPSGGIDLRQTFKAWTGGSDFIHIWGQEHRQPFPLFSGARLLVWANIGLLAFWLGPFQDDVPAHARIMLKILAASAVVGAMLSVAYWLPPSAVPNVLYASMPSRILNLNVISCMALLIALSWRYHDSVWIQANLAVLVIACSVSTAASGTHGVAARVGVGLAGPLLIVLTGLRRLHVGTASAPPWVTGALRRATLLVPAAALTVTGALALPRVAAFASELDESLFAIAASRPGVLLTASDAPRIQLRTRRAVLLVPYQLDAVVYAPESIAETDRILRQVYGIDSAHDVPQGAAAALWPDAGKALWQSRTTHDWQRVRREFGVTDVLTYSGWRLDLPVIARSRDYTLYAIP